MKKFLLIFTLSLFVFSFSFADTEKETTGTSPSIETIGKIEEQSDSQRDRSFIEVGTGTTTSGGGAHYFPYSNYAYSNRSQQLYLQSELGSAQTYTMISSYISRVAEAGHQEFTDFTVNFLHTDSTAFIAGAYYDMTGATEVLFSASYSFATTTGWFDIDIDDFAYNGTQNLIIEIIWGSEGAYAYTYYYNYKTQTPGVVRCLYGYDNVVFPPTYDNYYEGFSNTRFHYTIVGAPGDPTNPSPAHNATGLSITGDLTWDWGADSATYDLWLGETGSMVEVVTGAAVSGPSGSYAYSVSNYAAGYDWQIVVHNTNRVTIPGPVWSFSTGYPTEYVFESFETAVPPADVGWQVQNITGNDWDQYNYGSPYDGSYHARLYYASGGSESRLMTPLLSITNAYDFIDFYAYYYGGDSLTVQYSDDAVTWTDLEVIPITTTYARYSVDLSSLVPHEEYYIGFLGKTTPGYSMVYLDAVNHPPIVVGPPEAPSNPTPSDDGLFVDVNVDLTWSNGFGTETVDVYFGTNETLVTNKDVSVKVIDNLDVNTYDPGAMSNSTEYFWMVVCKNSARAEIDGPVWSFTTMPTGYVFESFETAVPPAEAGWQTQPIVGNYDWAQFSGSSPADGGYHARLYYTSGTGSDSRLMTPKLSVLNAYDVINFYSKFDNAGTLTVQYSADAVSWTDLEVITLTADYVQHTVDLSSLAARGEYYIGFLGETGTAYTSIYLDAVYHPVIVTGIPPYAPSNPNPADNLTNISATADISWSNGFQTETVDVYFGTNETLVTNKDASVKVIDDLDVETYDPGTMTYAAEYFWLVVGKNSARSETDGPVWSFTVENNPLYGGGGATSGGYYYANSLATAAPSYPTYNWIDNTGHTVVPIHADSTGNQDGYLSVNDFEGPFPIGFSFPFFTGTRGGNFTEFYIQSNGLINFAAEEIDSNNYLLPTDGAPTDFIAWFWDYMNAADPDILDVEVTYYSSADMCVITFWHYPEYEYWAYQDYVTAQVILYPNGNIKIQYNDTESTHVGMDYNGNTVGIEGDITGTAYGIQYRYNGTGGPHFGSDLALTFGLDENGLDYEVIVPDTPVNIVITINGNDVELDWDAASGATGYNIYRSTDPYSFGGVYDTSGTNSYTDTDAILDGLDYFYRVTATN